MMQVRCQICGTVTEIAAWTKEFENQKYGSQHPYICRACQQKIQLEAKDNQKS
ncbi:DUF2197 domain-containing protein [Sulfobacillus sp. hq2]|nr:DUF2197 domain-containing protein [Sulfobacillus sp. hq2]MCY0907269.1 DUF2197 domain-containing protein [Sulfobacillus thermotolerans]